MNWTAFGSTVIIALVALADLGVLVACAVSGVDTPPASEEALPVLVGALVLAAGRDAHDARPS